MTPQRLILATLLIAALLLALAGCTFIAFNKGAVTTVEKDSHNADGTNVHTFDTTISPR
jgi:hypothetical protein